MAGTSSSAYRPIEALRTPCPPPLLIHPWVGGFVWFFPDFGKVQVPPPPPKGGGTLDRVLMLH